MIIELASRSSVVHGAFAVPLILDTRLGYWMTCWVMGEVKRLAMTTKVPRKTKMLTVVNSDS